MKKCFNCRYFATEDEGYSDWTVMNTVVHCLHKLHPGMPCDETYSWYDDKKTQDSEFMVFAETCSKFEEDVKNERVEMNVDFYNEPYSSAKDINELAKKYFEQ